MNPLANDVGLVPWLLAAGTDGLDGASLDAGALVDGFTAERALLMEQDPEEALRRADSGRCLAASGDLFAMVQNHDPLAQVHDEPHVVLNEKHGHVVFVPNLTNHAVQLLFLLRVHSRGRLVKKQ